MKIEGDVWTIVSRYVTDQGTVIIHCYNLYADRSNAAKARTRILKEHNDPRLEFRIVKVLSV